MNLTLFSLIYLAVSREYPNRCNFNSNESKDEKKDLNVTVKNCKLQNNWNLISYILCLSKAGRIFNHIYYLDACMNVVGHMA